MNAYSSILVQHIHGGCVWFMNTVCGCRTDLAIFYMFRKTRFYLTLLIFRPRWKMIDSRVILVTAQGPAVPAFTPSFTLAPTACRYTLERDVVHRGVRILSNKGYSFHFASSIGAGL